MRFRPPQRTTWSLLLLWVCLVSCGSDDGSGSNRRKSPTKTPVEHVVVIFLENISFDAAFGIYPHASNESADEPDFHADAGTPSVNGFTEALLHDNPNQQPGANPNNGGSNPFRIPRRDCHICDANHHYAEQILARNFGLMNEFLDHGSRGPKHSGEACYTNDSGNYVMNMGYLDGNTVTALWNYAQHFALSDNHFATMVGESARGALNLAAADTVGVVCSDKTKPSDVWVDDGSVPTCGGPAMDHGQEAPSNGTVGVLVDDADPYWDECSRADKTVALVGRNLGDLLNEAGVSWGWFQGGFGTTEENACTTEHRREAFAQEYNLPPQEDEPLQDYVPHHNPFQFFQQTSNPRHLPPSSPEMVGRTDQANHQYDLEIFWDAAQRGYLPSVSFLKPPQYQNGHPAHSDPIDQQVFLVETINRLQPLREWESMAVIVAWDDSDGWYDHVLPPLVNRSNTTLDRVDATDASTGGCGAQSDGAGARCAYGPRIPLLVVSPWAKRNHVSSHLSDQTSITRFIEDNWLGGARISESSFDNIAGSIEDMFDFSPADEAQASSRKLFLDPVSGRVLLDDGGSLPP